MILTVMQIPRQIQHVREASMRDFSSLIDMSDVAGSPEQVEVHFLSRALAALIARKLQDAVAKPLRKLW